MASDKPRKIALITGGNRGLGKDMALSLAALGMDIVLTVNSNPAEGEAVAGEIHARGGRAAALHLDLSDTPALDGFMERLQALLGEAC